MDFAGKRLSVTIKQLVWRIGVPLLIIAACSPAAITPTAPPAAALSTQPATLGPIVTDHRPARHRYPPATDVPATEVPATPVPATEVAAVSDIPGRPSAPASPDEYRADPETLVGATGHPQLLEFFTYW